MGRKSTRPSARIIDVKKPNYLGLKWRFFEISIVLKNASIDYSVFSVIIFILDVFAFLCPAVYVLTGYNPEEQAEYSAGYAIFPLWHFFNLFVPNYIYVATWLYMQSIIISLILLIFLICFFAPRQCYFFHIFLNIRIHMVIFPMVAGSFAYDIYYFALKPSDGAGLIPTILHFCIFFLYFMMLTLLYFTECNSIVMTHSGVATWFSRYPLHYPLFLFLNTYYGFQILNFNLIARHILMLIIIIFCAISAIATFTQMPFILFISNEIHITKVITVAIIYLIDNLIIDRIIEPSSVYFCVLPLFLFFVYYVVHNLFNYRRKAILKLLSTLSDSNSIEPLADSNKCSASKMCLIVKLGILSGQTSVISPQFVQFCIEKYHDNEWLLSYVVFLYVVIWNNTEDVYKFMLHLLSLDIFNLATQFTLYQYVYCFMQTSQTISPVIIRKLEKYRRSVLKFVVAHRNFWMASVDRDTSVFGESNDQMAALMAKIEFEIKMLKILYPYCPAIHCERSLFEADFHHNYQKSDFYYQKAAALLDQSDSFMNSTFFYRYSIFFPGVKRSPQEKDNTKTGEYQYLSFFEQNDNALRSSVSLSINDQYITHLTHTFCQRKDIPTIDPKFDTWSRRIYLWLLFILFLVNVGIFAYQSVYNDVLNHVLIDYNIMNDFMQKTVQFRTNVNMAEFDILLTLSAAKKNESLYNFSLNHIKTAYLILNEYKSLYETLPNRAALQSIEQSFCFTNNCTFQYLFTQLNTILIHVLSSPASNLDLEKGAESVISSCNELFIMAEKIYFGFLKHFLKYEEMAVHGIVLNMIVVLNIEVFSAAVGAVLTTYLLFKSQVDVFDIVKTGQPPILNYIARQFDKIISYQKSQLPELRKYRKPTVLAQILIMIFLFIIPDALTLYFAGTNKIIVPNESLPILYNATECSQSTYLILNQIEIEHGNYCAHELFEVNLTKYSFYVSLTKYSDLIVTISKMTFIIVICITLWFGINSIKIAKHWKITKYALKFIPSHISHSNPIFHELLKEGKVKNSTVRQFLTELKTPPKNFDFFCILLFDENGKITKSLGQVQNFLSKTPKSLTKLKEFLLPMFELESPQINDFFECRTIGTQLSLCFPDGRDLSFSFSICPDSLIIKDDQLNAENNLRQRISHHLDEYLESRQTATSSIEQCVLLMFECQLQKTCAEISDKVSKYKSLRIIDSRNLIIVIISVVSESINLEFMNFIDDIKSINSQIRGVGVLGGPLMFFDAVKNMITKSRFVGDVYERAKKIMFEVNFGQLFFEMNLATECGIVEQRRNIKLTLIDQSEAQCVSYYG